MAPAANSVTSKTNHHLEGGDYQVVAWDLDTTGRRLIDEICQIGGFYVLANPPKEEKNEGNAKESGNGGCMQTFSQYVMPYKNPNPGARRSFGIKVVSVGRYRMLKDLDTGKILKTKSEVSALQDFLDWLKEAKSLSGKDGILLACHEPNRKVLVPLLLEALYKYNLLDQFNETVCGFVNGVSVVEKLGADFSITSHSLRSLCKTVLSDTNPTTASASDRSRVLIQIISKVCSPKNISSNSVSTLEDKEDTKSTSENPIQGSIRHIDASSILPVATTVQQEEEELRNLKGMLDTQGTLRPIFESHLRQKRSVRERAMQLRKIVAESGLDYNKVANIFTSAIPTSEEQNEDVTNDDKEKLEPQENENVMADLKSKIPDASD
jgi:maternal-effect protein exuperantia